MGRIIYFTGGSRSGKSSHAEKYIFDSDNAIMKNLGISEEELKNSYITL